MNENLKMKNKMNEWKKYEMNALNSPKVYIMLQNISIKNKMWFF